MSNRELVTAADLQERRNSPLDSSKFYACSKPVLSGTITDEKPYR